MNTMNANEKSVSKSEAYKSLLLEEATKLLPLVQFQSKEEYLDWVDEWKYHYTIQSRLNRHYNQAAKIFWPNVGKEKKERIEKQLIPKETLAGYLAFLAEKYPNIKNPWFLNQVRTFHLLALRKASKIVAGERMAAARANKQQP